MQRLVGEDMRFACGVLQVSGGPVYVSDRPGKHNMELLKRMVLPDGDVLLCTQPGRPTLDCLFADCMRDRQTLLKASASSSPNIPFTKIPGGSWLGPHRGDCWSVLRWGLLLPVHVLGCILRLSADTCQCMFNA